MSSRSLATVADLRTRHTEPTGRPSTSAIQHASPSGSKCSRMDFATPATSASKVASQPYSSAYKAPWRDTIQPKSPGRCGRITTVAAWRGPGARISSIARMAASSRACASGPSGSSKAPVRARDRVSSRWNARRPAGVGLSRRARPSSVDCTRLTSPARSSRATVRLTCAGSISSACTSAADVAPPRPPSSKRMRASVSENGVPRWPTPSAPILAV